MDDPRDLIEATFADLDREEREEDARYLRSRYRREARRVDMGESLSLFERRDR